MVMSNSLFYNNTKRLSDEIFRKITNCKLPYFYMSEINRYVNLGAITCTKITGTRYLIESNIDGRSIEINLK